MTSTLVATLLVTVARPAYADLRGNCNPGEVCLFRDPGYGGGFEDWVGDDRNYWGNVFRACGANCGLNDGASSAWNNGRQCGSYHFVHSDYNGNFLRLNRGQSVNDLGLIGWNDVFSSHKWCSP